MYKYVIYISVIYLMSWLNKLLHRIAPRAGDLRWSHVKGVQDGKCIKKTIAQVLREST